MIEDQNIDYKSKQVFIPVTEMNGGIGVASVGTGVPGLVEMSTLGIVGLKIDATSDAIQHFMPIPSEWDVTKAISMRLIYATGNTASSKTNTWRILYDDIAEGAALAAAATALDTALVAHTDDTTAYGLNKTAWGVINALKLTVGDFISLLIDLSATDLTLGTDNVHLIGLEIKYTPKLTKI